MSFDLKSRSHAMTPLVSTHYLTNRPPDNMEMKSIWTQSGYYCPQRSWGKVIFSEACVRNSVNRGVCLSACWDTRSRPRPGADTPPRADTLPSRHSPEQTPPEQCMLGDTANKRAVRILLEFILVCLMRPVSPPLERYWYNFCTSIFNLDVFLYLRDNMMLKTTWP